MKNTLGLSISLRKRIAASRWFTREASRYCLSLTRFPVHFDDVTISAANIEIGAQGSGARPGRIIVCVARCTLSLLGSPQGAA